MKLISKAEYSKDITKGNPFLNYDFFSKYIPEKISNLKKHSVENSIFLHIALFEKYFECDKKYSQEWCDNIINIHKL